MLAEGGVEVLYELTREPGGKLFLCGHGVLGGDHQKSFRRSCQTALAVPAVTKNEVEV